MNSSTFRSRASLSLIMAVLASFGIALWIVGVTRAAGTITVNSTLDVVNNSDGLCTLREAIIAANKDQASGSNSRECGAGNGTDTIIVPSGTYTLTRTDNGKEDASSTGDLDITSSIIISPTGPVTITAISTFTDRIFQVLSTGNLTISSMYSVTISGGIVTGDGGGINNGNVLTLANVTLSGNKASGKGGGIYNAGTLTINNSTVGSSNTAGTNGGGIYNAGTANLTNDTISGNAAKSDGGGLYNYSGTATLTNVTITNNTADSDANGTGNGGGGLFGSAGTVNVKNTIIAGNTDLSSATKHPDCSGTLTSLGYNLIGKDTGCTFTTQTGDQRGTSGSPIDPKLGPLQNNGGPTATHALLPGSPAIDAGTNTGCPTTDQRGISRPQGVACDIGAYERIIPKTPVIIRAFPAGGSTTVDGWQNANTAFTLNAFTSAACGGTFTPLGSVSVTTDGNGYFHATGLPPASSGQLFLIATASDALGNASYFSACVSIAGNDSWPAAMPLLLAGSPLSTTVDQYLDMSGQSRWYKFTVQPNSAV